MRVLLLILFSIPLGVVASEPIYSLKDGAYDFSAKTADECYSLGERSPNISECLQSFLVRSESDLNQAYEKVHSQLARDKKLFEVSQEKWSEFSIAECQLEASKSGVYSDPMTWWTLLYNVCITEARFERVLHLNRIVTGCSDCLQ
mgnify:CR=1 FL=1